MNENGFDTADLADLRERWEREQSPQLALQLAEVYGKRGLPERAAEVLERALRRREDHISARVALGRYRLELGETRASVEALERVVAADPTHLVANKLLVKGYSELGVAQKARDRLDLYRLLNESDPEIAAMQQLVAETPPAAREAPAEVSVDAEEPWEGESIETESGGSPDEESFEEAAEEPAEVGAWPASEPETLVLQAPEEESREVELPAERLGGAEAVEEPSAGREAGARELPFPDLWARLDAARYREGLFGELFRGAGPLRRRRGFAHEDLPLEAETPSEAALEEAVARNGASAAPGPAPVPGPEAAPDVEQLFASAAAEPEAGSEAEAGAEGSASVTLADLYAEQGHRAEAIRALRGVLGREPGNEKALRRLAALVAGEEDNLTAFHLLDARDFAAAVSLDERRARLLRSYLDRIGGGGDADV